MLLYIIILIIIFYQNSTRNVFYIRQECCSVIVPKSSKLKTITELSTVVNYFQIVLLCVRKQFLELRENFSLLVL